MAPVSAIDPEGPSWFRHMIATPAQPSTVSVRACRIAVRSWGQSTDQPPLVLVHGGRAHSHWWDHLAPWLAADRRVVAMDLSGHGDSGWRSSYSYDIWGVEILAVAATVAEGRAPVVVGHSMGGQATIAAAAASTDLAGVVIIDAGVYLRQRPQRQLAWTPRVYPSEQAAVEAFRLVPKQGRELDWAVRHVARHSVRPVDGGWTWKVDPGYIGRAEWVTADVFAAARCDVTLLRSQFGVMVRSDLDAAWPRVRSRCRVLDVRGAHHHAMLDRPLVLLRVLRSALEQYS